MTISSAKKHLSHKLSQTTNLVYHRENRGLRIVKLKRLFRNKQYELHNLYSANSILASESLGFAYMVLHSIHIPLVVRRHT